MKAKELAELLLQHPNFNVKAVYVDYFSGEQMPKHHNLNIIGIADVGYSDKIIILDCA